MEKNLSKENMHPKIISALKKVDPCPSSDELCAWVEKKVAKEESKHIEEHILRCSQCREIVRILRDSQHKSLKTFILKRSILFGAAIAATLIFCILFFFKKETLKTKALLAIERGEYAESLDYLEKWITQGKKEERSIRENDAVSLILGEPPETTKKTAPRNSFRKIKAPSYCLRYPVGPVFKRRPDFIIEPSDTALKLIVRKLKNEGGSESLFIKEIPPGVTHVCFPENLPELTPGLYYAILEDDEGNSFLSTFLIKPFSKFKTFHKTNIPRILLDALKIKVLIKQGFFADALRLIEKNLKRNNGPLILYKWKKALEEKVCLKR